MNKLKNQKGQALIFVVGTLTIAMAVGVGVAVRNLSSISRSSRTDTSTRAHAAAEAGVESYLTKSEEELSNLVGAPGSTTTLPPSSTDNITATYTVSVDTYGDINASGSSYLSLLVNANEVVQVFLGGNDNVKVCWTPTDSNKDTNIFLTAYSEDASDSDDITSIGITSGDGNNNYESNDGSNSDFDYCYNNVPFPTNPEALRIRSIGGGSSIGVYPNSGSFPSQGFEVTSVGRLVTAGSETEDVEAKVVVRKSYSYLPGFFDLAIYSGDSL